MQDAQGNVIYPCGYKGGAKDRTLADAIFEENEVSLSSVLGIAQVEKDNELQVCVPVAEGLHPAAPALCVLCVP